MDKIDKNMILVGQELQEQKDVFEFLGKEAVIKGLASDEVAVTQALWARESESTTGMLDGFAIPHAKSDRIIQTGIIIVKNNIPIEWKAMDGQPINFIIALFIPKDNQGEEHLKTLATISRLLMKKTVKSALQHATTAEEIAETFNQYL
ncbi:MAG: fructose PTS transporter subunit IIA [Aerococcus sp.]|nr:fructose PTS transporter subunit IIA [Aerococcus sp.]